MQLLSELQETIEKDIVYLVSVENKTLTDFVNDRMKKSLLEYYKSLKDCKLALTTHDSIYVSRYLKDIL